MGEGNLCGIFVYQPTIMVTTAALAQESRGFVELQHYLEGAE